jgi:hypothetical protein
MAGCERLLGQHLLLQESVSFKPGAADTDGLVVVIVGPDPGVGRA